MFIEEVSGNSHFDDLDTRDNTMSLFEILQTAAATQIVFGSSQFVFSALPNSRNSEGSRGAVVSNFPETQNLSVLKRVYDEPSPPLNSPINIDINLLNMISPQAESRFCPNRDDIAELQIPHKVSISAFFSSTLPF